MQESERLLHHDREIDQLQLAVEHNGPCVAYRSLLRDS